MKDEILAHIEQPRHLEKLYRSNKTSFKNQFNLLYPELKGRDSADFWYERLNFESEEINWGSRKEFVVVIVAALLACLVVKLPALFNLNEEFFYPRNIGFVIFPALTGYFAWKYKLPNGKIAVIAASSLIGLLFINSLPHNEKSDTLILSCIHLALFLWSILGFTWSSREGAVSENRLAYLRYNGDLVVMTTLILIAGGLMSAITVGLFSLIGINIDEFYFENVAIYGFATAPILATYLTQTNPHLVGKVSPVIARIFSPLVLAMLVIYLIAIVYSGKDPYNDREFLLIFNALLVGVMAIIFFSVAETSTSPKSRAEVWVLFLLAAVTIIVNGIALSAIVFRISEFGITPNRTAVLGANLLILINLTWVTLRLFTVLSSKGDIRAVGKTMVTFLPFYVGWTIIVTFLFPLLFGFK